MTTNSSRPATGAAAGAAAAAKPASPYARFIPREELGTFAAWHMQTLDTAPEAPPADTAPDPFDAAEVQARIAAARQGGYHDGYRDGLVALDSFKQAHSAQIASQLAVLLRSFDAQLDALEQQMAQSLAQAAVMLARRIVRAELQTRPEHVAEAARQALAAVLLSARHIRVLVHPDDHALVASGAAEALHARGAQLLAHAEVERGGCLVESDLGRVDAGIAARWDAAAASLGSALPWHGTPEDAA